MGKHFDKLCDISRDYGSTPLLSGEITISQLVKQSHLFEVQKELKSTIKESKIGLFEEVYAPFEVCAFEYTRHLILLISPPEAITLAECKWIVLAGDSNTNGFSVIITYQYQQNNCVKVNGLHIKLPNNKNKKFVSLTTEAELENALTDMPDVVDELVRRTIILSGVGSYNILRMLKDIAYFTVEEIPEGKPKRPKLTQQKTKYRSKYILLKPQQARKLMCIDQAEQGSERSKPITHERRGHWRRLAGDRFNRNEDGTVKKVWVKPTWVGQSEAVVNGKIYKIILD